jgi:hypothetical protein
VIRQLEDVVLPADDKALALLETLLAGNLTTEQRECLTTQRNEIGIHRAFMARVRNWFRASYHICAGSQPYDGLTPLPEIIQDEIDVSRAWHRYEGVSEDGPRIALMEAHKNDLAATVDLREFPTYEYLGLNHWPGAHLAKA